MRESRAEPNQLFASVVVSVLFVAAIIIAINGTAAMFSDLADQFLRPCQSTELLSQVLLCR